MTPVALPGWGSFAIFAVIPVVLGGVGGLMFHKRREWLGAWPGWMRLVVLNVLATLFFASTLFLMAETYCRCIQDTTLPFNSTFVSLRWFQRHYQKNSAGLRDNVEYPDQIPAGKRRITFLGDSFTAAQGVKNVNDRFANLLRQRHPEWDIQVIAAMGLDTGNELDLVRSMAARNIKLDCVVLVYCLNDISDIMPEWGRALAHIYNQPPKRNWLVDHSYFADMGYFLLKVRRDPAIPDFFALATEAYRGPLFEVQKQRLAAIRQTVESSGGKLIVVTFPLLDNIGPTYPFRPAHESLGEFWKSQKVPHLDLLPVLEKHPPVQLVVNRLDNHPNEFAHSLAADEMEKFFTSHLSSGP